MPVHVDFRPGSEAAARLIGLPALRLDGRPGVIVREPPGWSERELTSWIVQRVGPYLASIETVKTAQGLGHCNCLGRRR